MDFTKIGESLASQGVLGIVVVVVAWAYYKKDVELRDERNARINDAKDFTNRVITIQERVIDAVNKLSDILEETKKLLPGGNR